MPPRMKSRTSHALYAPSCETYVATPHAPLPRGQPECSASAFRATGLPTRGARSQKAVVTPNCALLPPIRSPPCDNGKSRTYAHHLVPKCPHPLPQKRLAYPLCVSRSCASLPIMPASIRVSGKCLSKDGVPHKKSKKRTGVKFNLICININCYFNIL